MRNLNFGTDIRIENLMLLEAISDDDVEVISYDADSIEEAGIVIPV